MANEKEEFERASGGRKLDVGENGAIHLNREGKPQLPATSFLKILCVVLTVLTIAAFLIGVSMLIVRLLIGG